MVTILTSSYLIFLSFLQEKCQTGKALFIFMGNTLNFDNNLNKRKDNTGKIGVQRTDVPTV